MDFCTSGIGVDGHLETVVVCHRGADGLVVDPGRRVGGIRGLLNDLYFYGRTGKELCGQERSGNDLFIPVAIAVPVIKRCVPNPGGICIDGMAP